MARLKSLLHWLNHSLTGDLIGAVCLFGLLYLSLFLEILT